MPLAVLAQLQLTPDDVRRMLSMQGVAVRTMDRDEITTSHLRTSYLDGDAQRYRKAQLAANEGTILAWAIQGIPVKQIAASFLVSEEAIHARLRKVGFSSARTVCSRPRSRGAKTGCR